MAEDIRHFTISTPAGTAQAVPLVSVITFPPRVVESIDWRVPTGPMGTTGFLLAMGTVPVLPVYGQPTYVVADGEHGTWEPSQYPDSGGWSVWSYNTGANPHNVFLTFHLGLPAKVAVARPLLPAYVLGPSPDLSHAGPPVGGRM